MINKDMSAQAGEPVQALIDAAVEQAVKMALAGVDERIRAVVDDALAHTAQTAAKAAIGAVEREKVRIKRDEYDWKLHNVKLLLRNYRKLSEYFQNAVIDLDGAEEIDESFDAVMRMMRNRDGNDDLFVESLQRNYLQTKIIMSHVERMLDVYADMCERSRRPETARHWRCLYYMYLAPEGMSADEIAEAEHIERRTVYKDIDTCVSDLTALLFGVSGLERPK